MIILFESHNDKIINFILKLIIIENSFQGKKLAATSFENRIPSDVSLQPF